MNCLRPIANRVILLFQLMLQSAVFQKLLHMESIEIKKKCRVLLQLLLSIITNLTSNCYQQENNWLYECQRRREGRELKQVRKGGMRVSIDPNSLSTLYALYPRNSIFGLFFLFRKYVSEEVIQNLGGTMSCFPAMHRY